MDATAQADAVLRQTTLEAQQRLTGRLVAVYALGSLAHGGFSGVSDVDVGLILSDPLQPTDAQQIEALVVAVKVWGQPFAERLSLFWGSPDSLKGQAQGGRFPPLDRLDLIQYGRLLYGQDVRASLLVPSQTELIEAAAEFALSRLASETTLAQIKHPQQLLESGPKNYTKLVLFPVRFVYTAQTGQMGQNDAAVAHYVAQQAPGYTLAQLALQWRNQAPHPSDSAALTALADGLIPIYQTFLHDYIARLESIRPDLAGGLQTWLERF